MPTENASEVKTKECIFRNFKVCYRPQPDSGYDYVLCSACLLSRIEKTIFKAQNKNSEKDNDNKTR